MSEPVTKDQIAAAKARAAETGGIIDDGQPSAFVAGRAVQLDGHFTIEDLEALLVLMRAKVDPYE